jgi:hypothetical protein
MTNKELVDRLTKAQALLSDVYHWASEQQPGLLVKNSEVASQMSVADSCIIDALDALDWDRGIE